MSTGDLRFTKSIRRVTFLDSSATGQVSPTVLYERKSSKKKRQSRMLEPLERIVRRAADAGAAGAERYVVKHRKSNTKRRDGWLRDVGTNLFRAARQGTKRAKMNRWLSM